MLGVRLNMGGRVETITFYALWRHLLIFFLFWQTGAPAIVATNQCEEAMSVFRKEADLAQVLFSSYVVMTMCE